MRDLNIIYLYFTTENIAIVVRVSVNRDKLTEYALFPVSEVSKQESSLFIKRLHRPIDGML
jgi:hypothetical protein